VAQWKLTDPSIGSFFTVSIGWAMGVTFGVYVAGGVSGGHINPAVTLTMAIFRRIKWIKVPVYMAGQYLGAFAGAAVVYGLYYDLLKHQEHHLEVPKYAGIFATYPNKDINSGTQFGNELVATAMLMMLIMAVLDKVNSMIRGMLNG
jgi:MIP family channel proteins